MSSHMSTNVCSTDASIRSEVRQRIADRLGFLLAKRWIRLHQDLEMGGEENSAQHCRETGEAEPPRSDSNAT